MKILKFKTHKEYALNLLYFIYNQTYSFFFKCFVSFLSILLKPFKPYLCILSVFFYYFL